MATCQCLLTGKKGFFATRALLGFVATLGAATALSTDAASHSALEGGFIPDMILYLSYFYTTAELTIRLSFFWVALTTTTIIGSLIAAGVLQMRGINGWGGWQWLFLIEGTQPSIVVHESLLTHCTSGIVTLCVGIFAAFWLPPSPTQTAGGIRGKGWFSEREETIIVSRVLRDDPTKSSMHNREAIGFKELWRSLTDFDHIPLYLLGVTTYIAPNTVNAYFTLTLKSLCVAPSERVRCHADVDLHSGFSTFHTNLLTIPPNVLFSKSAEIDKAHILFLIFILAVLNNLGVSFLSRKVKERGLVASIGSWWLLIGFIALVAVPNDTAVWSKYAIFVIILGYPYAHPSELFSLIRRFGSYLSPRIVLVSWNSAISGSVRTRSVSASLCASPSKPTVEPRLTSC